MDRHGARDHHIKTSRSPADLDLPPPFHPPSRRSCQDKTNSWGRDLFKVGEAGPHSRPTLGVACDSHEGHIRRREWGGGGSVPVHKGLIAGDNKERGS